MPCTPPKSQNGESSFAQRKGGFLRTGQLKNGTPLDIAPVAWNREASILFTIRSMFDRGFSIFGLYIGKPRFFANASAKASCSLWRSTTTAHEILYSWLPVRPNGRQPSV